MKFHPNDWVGNKNKNKYIRFIPLPPAPLPLRSGQAQAIKVNFWTVSRIADLRGPSSRLGYAQAIE